jgi:hypothetical protein
MTTTGAIMKSTGGTMKMPPVVERAEGFKHRSVLLLFITQQT